MLLGWLSSRQKVFFVHRKGQKYRQKHETKRLVEFPNHLHALRAVALNCRKTMVLRKLFWSKSSTKRLHGWFYEVTFSVEFWHPFNQKAHAQQVPVLCRAFQWKTGKSSRERAPGKGKEEAFFSTGRESSHHFSYCSMKFLFGEKMEQIFWEIISLEIQATDFC